MTIKGRMIFCYSKGGIKYRIFNYENEIKNPRYLGDLIDGKEFYEDVDSLCITDYDGEIHTVFIDEYISNLGLCHADFMQGSFLVDGNTWLEICNKYDVKVEWCNK